MVTRTNHVTIWFKQNKYYSAVLDILFLYSGSKTHKKLLTKKKKNPLQQRFLSGRNTIQPETVKKKKKRIPVAACVENWHISGVITARWRRIILRVFQKKAIICAVSGSGGDGGDGGGGGAGERWTHRVRGQ